MTERKIETEIILSGAGLERFLDHKGVPKDRRSGNGSIVVARYADEENCVDTIFGKIGLGFELLNNTGNRAIVIFSSGLRRRGRKDVRRVSINHTNGVGEQQFTSGVSLIVRTNAPAQYFEDNKS